jgi:hypothetical protein
MRRLRSALVLLGLAGVWFAVVLMWTDVYGEQSIFDAATVLITVAAGLVSALWLASLRFASLRHALLPLDAGIIVGGIVFAIGARGVEVDTPEDAAVIAVVMGLIATIVITIVARLLDGRRSQPLWVGSLVAVAVAVGVAIPAIADQLAGDAGMYVGDGSSSYALVLSRVNTDGDVLLGQSSDIQLGDAYEHPGDFEGSMSQGSDGSIAVPGEDESMSAYGRAPRLVARAGGALELHFSDLPVGAGVTLHVRVESGACSTGGTPPARPLSNPENSTIRATSAGAKLALRTLTLSDLKPGDELRVVFGSGASLAPVRCVDLLDDVTPLLAQRGLGSFGRDCIAPLRLDPGVQVQLTPSSFQDRGCATQLESLARLSRTTVVADETSARAVAACMRDSEGVDATVTPITGGKFVVESSGRASGAATVGECSPTAGVEVPGALAPAAAATPVDPELPGAVVE